MNLALDDSLVWRGALRAVPESNRPEVLGTLTEYYGPKAPLSEAFRTFTSGSRMHNRENASSPIDLWREAARSALVFIVVFAEMQSFGGIFLLHRNSYSTRFGPKWFSLPSQQSLRCFSSAAD